MRLEYYFFLLEKFISGVDILISWTYIQKSYQNHMFLYSNQWNCLVLNDTLFNLHLENRNKDIEIMKNIIYDFSPSNVKIWSPQIDEICNVSGNKILN